MSNDPPAPSPFLLCTLWMNQWVDGSPSFLPLFHYTLLPLFSFFRKKKRRYGFILQINNPKHAGEKGSGGGQQKSANQTEPGHNNLPPRGGCFPNFFLNLIFSFRSCPCLCVLLAKSHIPSPPLPAQTPFGGPSFPTAALGITCHTHICKPNQVWKGQGVPAQLRKAAAATAADSLPRAPEVGVSGWLPVTEPQLPHPGTVKPQRP